MPGIIPDDWRKNNRYDGSETIMPDDWRELVKGKKQIPKEELIGSEFPPFFTFEETGDFIDGTISDPREIEIEDRQHGGTKMVKVVTITTKDGTKYSLGLTANLRGLFEMEGKHVLIKYEGMKKAGKFYAKDFTVYE